MLVVDIAINKIEDLCSLESVSYRKIIGTFYVSDVSVVSILKKGRLF